MTICFKYARFIIAWDVVERVNPIKSLPWLHHDEMANIPFILFIFRENINEAWIHKEASKVSHDVTCLSSFGRKDFMHTNVFLFLIPS